MAGRGAPTFKKRQKEQQRKEKQQQKMARRVERKDGSEGDNSGSLDLNDLGENDILREIRLMAEAERDAAIQAAAKAAQGKSADKS